MWESMFTPEENLLIARTIKHDTRFSSHVEAFRYLATQMSFSAKSISNRYYRYIRPSHQQKEKDVDMIVGEINETNSLSDPEISMDHICVENGKVSICGYTIEGTFTIKTN